MGIERFQTKIEKQCANDEAMKEMLFKLFEYQLDGPGRWKNEYLKIISDAAKKESAQNENK